MTVSVFGTANVRGNCLEPLRLKPSTRPDLHPGSLVTVGPGHRDPPPMGRSAVRSAVEKVLLLPILRPMGKTELPEFHGILRRSLIIGPQQAVSSSTICLFWGWLVGI